MGRTVKIIAGLTLVAAARKLYRGLQGFDSMAGAAGSGGYGDPEAP